MNKHNHDNNNQQKDSYEPGAEKGLVFSDGGTSQRKGEDAMKRLILQSTRDHGSKLRFGLRACATTALLVSGLIFAFRALLYADTPNLTGTYTADDGGIYYVQQSGSTLWWIGMSLDADPHVAQVFHRGLAFTNIFKGEVRSDNTVAGEWADVSRGLTLNKGTLNLQISPASGGSGGSGYQLTAVTKTG